MKTLHATCFASAALFAACGAFSGCAASSDAKRDPSVAEGEGTDHHHPELAPSTVVELGPGKPGIAIEPAGAKQDAAPEVPADLAPVARMPIGATVFFRNTSRDHFIQLAVNGDFRSCAGCVSVTNFTCLQHGALATAIEPGGVSTLCFHKPGRYPLRVTGGDPTLVGALEIYDPSGLNESLENQK